jgi:ABC-type transport system substrate-binding protein
MRFGSSTKWSKIGVKVTQRVLQTGPFGEALRQGKFDTVVDGDCQNIVNPLLDGTKYLPHSVSPSNYGDYDDPATIEIYDRMVRETDFPRQRELIRQFEKLVLDTGARNLPAMALSHRAVSQVCQRLEGEPEPLRQPGSGDDLAR